MPTTLPQYLTQKFIEWQGELQQRKTMREFASYLSVSRSLLSYWMNGTRQPSHENIDKLAEVLGNEIYDILGLPRPDENFSYLEKIWDELMLEHQLALKEQAMKYITKNERDQKSKKNLE